MNEELFGIRALESYFNRVFYSVKKTLVPRDKNWKNKNIQPKREISKTTKIKNDLFKRAVGYGICPHYDLIELCAEVLGIKPNELVNFEYFCGVLEEDLIVSGIGGSNPEKGGIIENPFWCCRAIRDMLVSRIKLAKTRKPKSIGEISKRPSEQEAKKVQKFIEAQNLFDLGQEVLTFWSKVVPKVIGTKKKKYSKEELIREVEGLVKQLEAQAVKRDSVLRNETCALAPKFERLQWLWKD